MKINRLLNLIALITVLSACTTREAAIIAAVPGRIIGTPMGMIATTVDESFATAGDIVQANPRHDRCCKGSLLQKHRPTQRSPTDLAPPLENTGFHYYKAEVLIKTRGRAQFESIQMLDSQDVTNFWQQSR